MKTKKSKSPSPNKPSPDKIKAEISKLRAIKPKVLRVNFFGENHHDAIDAQIQVLEARWSEYKIYDYYGMDCYGVDAPIEEGDLTDDVYSDNILQAALSARRWLNGRYDEYPSLHASWKDLVRK